MIVTGTDQELRKRPVTPELEYDSANNQYAVAPNHGWDMGSDFSVLVTFTSRSLSDFGLVGERTSDVGTSNWWLEWNGTQFVLRADDAFTAVAYTPPADFFQVDRKYTWFVSVNN